MKILTVLLLSLGVFSAPHTEEKVQKRLIRPGQTIYSLLKKNRFSKHQIAKVMQKKHLFAEGYTLIPKKPYWVLTQRTQNKTTLKFAHPHKDEVLSIWKNKTNAGVHVSKESYDVKVKTVTGKINGSIIGSIQNKTKNKDIAYRFLDAYRLDYNLRKQVQRGAPFSVSYEEKYTNGQFIKTGEVLKTEVVINKKNDVRYFLKHKSGGSFVSKKQTKSNKPLYAPVGYVRISSEYKPSRFHPIRRRYRAHLGVDFELPEGSNIYSSSDGEIIRMGRTRGAGNFVVIQHANGLSSFYNHMSKIHPDMHKGKILKSGQIIGYIGCTGLCTKPHLHYSVKKHGKYVNPAKYIRSYPGHQETFIKKRMAQLKDKFLGIQ